MFVKEYKKETHFFHIANTQKLNSMIINLLTSKI